MSDIPLSELSEMPNTICSRCGTDFHCGVSAGKETCGCFLLPHVAPLPTDENAASGCLCPACLRQWIKQQVIQNA